MLTQLASLGRSPDYVLKLYFSRLNSNFSSAKFSLTTKIWYEQRQLGDNMLETTQQKMTKKAAIFSSSSEKPFDNNYSLVRPKIT